MTTIPRVQFSNTGATLPETATVYDAALVLIDEALGGNINIDTKGTPQDQFATVIADAVTYADEMLAFLPSTIDPAQAKGIYQDNIGRITVGFQRKPAKATEVVLTFLGIAGTVVPPGTVIADVNKNQFETTINATIDVSGTVDVLAICRKTGRIGAPPYTVTILTSAIPGVDRVYNQNYGVIGYPEESQREFELRRQASVAKNGRGTLASIIGAVYDIQGVYDVYAAENYENYIVTIGQTLQFLTPHSIFVAALGGTDLEVATAIRNKKSDGAGMNGNTVVSVPGQSGYSSEPPINITFCRPTPVSIFFRVEIINRDGLPSQLVQIVQNAIIQASQGLDGRDRLRIGGTVVGSRFFEPIEATGQKIQVSTCRVGFDNLVYHNEIRIGVNQHPVVEHANIAIVLI